MVLLGITAIDLNNEIVDGLLWNVCRPNAISLVEGGQEDDLLRVCGGH